MVETMRSHVEHFQKPCSPCPGAGSQRMRVSKDPLSRYILRCMARWGKLRRRRSSGMRQIPRSNRCVFGGGQQVLYIGMPTTLSKETYQTLIWFPYLIDLMTKYIKIKIAKRSNAPTRQGSSFQRTFHTDACAHHRAMPCQAKGASTHMWSFPSLLTPMTRRGGDNLHIDVGHPLLELAR